MIYQKFILDYFKYCWKLQSKRENGKWYIIRYKIISYGQNGHPKMAVQNDSPKSLIQNDRY